MSQGPNTFNESVVWLGGDRIGVLGPRKAMVFHIAARWHNSRMWGSASFKVPSARSLCMNPFNTGTTKTVNSPSIRQLSLCMWGAMWLWGVLGTRVTRITLTCLSRSKQTQNIWRDRPCLQVINTSLWLHLQYMQLSWSQDAVDKLYQSTMF